MALKYLAALAFAATAINPIYLHANEADTRLGTVEMVDGEMRFREPSIAFLPIPLGDGLTRRIAIHRGAERSDAGEIVYFHVPLFAFETHPGGAAPHGHPLIHASRQIGDRRLVRFRLHTSDEGLRAGQMRVAAYEADKNFIHARDLDYNRIRVEPVHLVRVTMRMRDWGSGPDRWPVAESANLAAFDDLIELDAEFDNEEFAAFLAALEAGEVSFDISYAAATTIQRTASITQIHMAEATGAIDQAITHQNISPGDPIFQSVRSRFEQDVRERFRTASFASSPEAAALLPAINFADSVFTPVTIQSLSEAAAIDDRLAQQIHDHLQPIIERNSVKSEETETTTQTEQQTEDRTDTRKRITNFDLKVIGGISMGEKQEDTREIKLGDLERLERQHGVKFTEERSTGNLRPSEIEVSYLAEGWQAHFRSAAAHVAIDAGVYAGFMRDSPIPQDFTLEHLHNVVGQWFEEETSPYPHLPVGAALCYFGEHAPEGFTWADGETRFPQEDWVAENLRGRLMPNMNQDGLLVGATGTSDQVGDLRKPVALQLPELVVEQGALNPINDIQPHQVRLNQLLQIRAAEFSTFYSIPGGMGPPPKNNLGTNLDALIEVTSASKGDPNKLEGCRIIGNATVCRQPIPGIVTLRPIDLNDNVPVSVASGIAGELSLGEVLPRREHAPEHVACRWIVRLQ